MKVGSLFTGIGGFELGAKWAGFETVYACEIDPYLRKLIKQNFPEIELIHDDVKTFNPNIYADIITAGFPCTDISQAKGKEAEGINGTDSGLWKEVIRICGKRRPKYVILENSPKLLIRGMGHLIRAFSEIGYVCEWECLSNHQFGGVDKRERLFIVAYPFGVRPQTDRPVFNRH